MDVKAAEAGGMSDHASREYLAWSNTLTRTLVRLGLQGAAQRPLTPEETMAAIYARYPANPGPQTRA
jgi:hypothetical protein